MESKRVFFRGSVGIFWQLRLAVIGTFLPLSLYVRHVTRHILSWVGRFYLLFIGIQNPGLCGILGTNERLGSQSNLGVCWMWEKICGWLLECWQHFKLAFTCVPGRGASDLEGTGPNHRELFGFDQHILELRKDVKCWASSRAKPRLTVRPPDSLFSKTLSSRFHTRCSVAHFFDSGYFRKSLELEK